MCQPVVKQLPAPADGNKVVGFAAIFIDPDGIVIILRAIDIPAVIAGCVDDQDVVQFSVVNSLIDLLRQ